MRLATICDAGGIARPVFESDGQWVDLRALTGAGAAVLPNHPADLSQVVGHLEEIAEAAGEWRDEAKRMQSTSVESTDVRFLPPVAARTFRDFYVFEQHVAACRAKRKLAMEPAWYEQPVFYFSNPTSLVGHGFPVHAPFGSRELDYELELGLIIGRGGRNISREHAWRHVAGFTIINDFSARDLQRREMSVGLGPAKGKDFATAVGPWLTTLDDVRDRIDASGGLSLTMTARVNGKEFSRGNSADMHFSWPQIIEHASRDAQLLPGDLLGSGTVGTGCILELGPENTGGWLAPGDIVELEIERLGVLRTPIEERPAQERRTTRNEAISCQST